MRVETMGGGGSDITPARTTTAARPRMHLAERAPEHRGAAAAASVHSAASDARPGRYQATWKCSRRAPRVMGDGMACEEGVAGAPVPIDASCLGKRLNDPAVIAQTSARHSSKDADS